MPRISPHSRVNRPRIVGVAGAGVTASFSDGLGPLEEIVGAWTQNGDQWTKPTADWLPLGCLSKPDDLGKTYFVQFKVEQILTGTDIYINRRNAANTSSEGPVIEPVAGVTYEFYVTIVFVRTSDLPSIWIDSDNFTGTISNYKIQEVLA